MENNQEIAFNIFKNFKKCFKNRFKKLNSKKDYILKVLYFQKHLTAEEFQNEIKEIIMFQ